MDEFDEWEESSNSELRYLTLELMKLAYRQGKRFEEVAAEYIRNVYLLKSLIEREGKGVVSVGKERRG